MKKLLTVIISCFALQPMLSSAQTILINSSGNGGFETGNTFALNNWTVVNGAQTNKWFVGTAPTGYTGARCAYISDDGAGATHNYNITSASIVHFYMDVTIPAGQDVIDLTFDYKCIGQNGVDRLRIYWADVTVTPTAGALPAAPGATFPALNNTNWRQASVALSCAGYAGLNKRLIFTWENNSNTGTQPPAGIDNISLTCKSSTPVNDLPCNATVLTLSVPVIGDNRCAGNASEPATPACWGAGTVNTVWYSIVCPASGQLRIRTNVTTSPFTLANSQIALYSGACGALVNVSCNDDAPACGGITYRFSQISAAGLTPSATYYIAVDGRTSTMGEFSIVVSDGASSLPSVPGQDCSSPLVVCNQNTQIGNPGYLANGNICDFNGSGNCTNGERGSVWYRVDIAANGNLMFSVIPNDYNGVNCTGESDYDFIVWRIVGTGATDCGSIQSSGGGGAVSCNYDAQGHTGCYTGGNAPAGVNSCFDAAYEAPIPVLAGESYLIVIQNYSNSTSGFTLDFSNTTVGVINYGSSPTSVNWTGGSNTVWTVNNNWGGCATPSCTVDGTITTASFNQPILTAGTYTVKNLTINAGATLTINAGVTLQICGNFVNNGSLIADPTSTIEFVGTGLQTITGSFLGANSFGNLTVTKTSGSVQLINDISVAGNFLISNGTSVFDINGDILRVAGNFTNNNGNVTFTGVAGSTLMFTGSANQNYIPGGNLTLNNVTVNQTVASTVTVNAGNNLIIGASGVLTLTSGAIVTNGTDEVVVNNTASGAVTTGTTTSYVRGRLRRFLNGAATSYDFPVGTAAMGYQRANITFTTATTIPSLLAFFNNWGAVPNGPASNECVAANYALLPMLNNGFWTITASANPTSGNYNVSLYNTNHTNSGGASGWTVVKNSGMGWGLNGTCVLTSTVGNTQRTGLNGFSDFGVGQSTSPLPIQLLYFSGHNLGSINKLEWETVTETNNDFFTIEKSVDGVNFNVLGIVDGAGTSHTSLYYYLFDEMPFSPVTYYRLKQTDFDGQYTYSDVIAIESSAANTLISNIYPNPTNSEFSFELISSSDGLVLIDIIDVYGNIVSTSSKSVVAGTNIINQNIANLASGVYAVCVGYKTKYINTFRIIKI